MLRAAPIRLHFAALIAASPLMAALPVQAQQSACQEGGVILTERRTLGEQLMKAKNKEGKLDPRAACPVLTKMVTNGEAGLKWIEANKDWCQVPDQLVENFSADHNRMKTVRTQACQIAAKIAEMEKKARQTQQQGGGGLLGGNSLTGEYKIPRGAL